MMTPDEMRMLRTLIDQETNRIADNIEALSTLMRDAYHGRADDGGDVLRGHNLRDIFHELAQAIRKGPP